jgi:hypothetical protein
MPKKDYDVDKWVVYTDDVINNVERLKMKARADYKSRIFFLSLSFFLLISSFGVIQVSNRYLTQHTAEILTHIQYRCFS